MDICISTFIVNTCANLRYIEFSKIDRTVLIHFLTSTVLIGEIACLCFDVLIKFVYLFTSFIFIQFRVVWKMVGGSRAYTQNNSKKIPKQKQASKELD